MRKAKLCKEKNDRLWTTRQVQRNKTKILNWACIKIVRNETEQGESHRKRKSKGKVNTLILCVLSLGCMDNHQEVSRMQMTTEWKIRVPRRNNIPTLGVVL